MCTLPSKCDRRSSLLRGDSGARVGPDLAAGTYLRYWTVNGTGSPSMSPLRATAR